MKNSEEENVETIRIGDRVKCTDECYKYEPSHHVCYGEVVGEYFPITSQNPMGWLVKRDDGYSAFTDIDGVVAHPYEGLWIALGAVEHEEEIVEGWKPDTFVFDLIKRIRDTL